MVLVHLIGIMKKDSHLAEFKFERGLLHRLVQPKQSYISRNKNVMLNLEQFSICDHKEHEHFYGLVLQRDFMQYEKYVDDDDDKPSATTAGTSVPAKRSRRAAEAPPPIPPVLINLNSAEMPSDVYSLINSPVFISSSNYEIVYRAMLGTSTGLAFFDYNENIFEELTQKLTLQLEPFFGKWIGKSNKTFSAQHTNHKQSFTLPPQSKLICSYNNFWTLAGFDENQLTVAENESFFTGAEKSSYKALLNNTNAAVTFTSTQPTTATNIANDEDGPLKVYFKATLLQNSTQRKIVLTEDMLPENATRSITTFLFNQILTSIIQDLRLQAGILQTFSGTHQAPYPNKIELTIPSQKLESIRTSNKYPLQINIQFSDKLQNRLGIEFQYSAQAKSAVPELLNLTSNHILWRPAVFITVVVFNKIKPNDVSISTDLVSSIGSLFQSSNRTLLKNLTKNIGFPRLWHLDEIQHNLVRDQRKLKKRYENIEKPLLESNLTTIQEDLKLFTDFLSKSDETLNDLNKLLHLISDQTKINTFKTQLGRLKIDYSQDNFTAWQEELINLSRDTDSTNINDLVKKSTNLNEKIALKHQSLRARLPLLQNLLDNDLKPILTEATSIKETLDLQQKQLNTLKNDIVSMFQDLNVASTSFDAKNEWLTLKNQVDFYKSVDVSNLEDAEITAITNLKNNLSRENQIIDDSLGIISTLLERNITTASLENESDITVLENLKTQITQNKTKFASIQQKISEYQRTFSPTLENYFKKSIQQQSELIQAQLDAFTLKIQQQKQEYQDLKNLFNQTILDVQPTEETDPNNSISTLKNRLNNVTILDTHDSLLEELVALKATTITTNTPTKLEHLRLSYTSLEKKIQTLLQEFATTLTLYQTYLTDVVTPVVLKIKKAAADATAASLPTTATTTTTANSEIEIAENEPALQPTTTEKKRVKRKATLNFVPFKSNDPQKNQCSSALSSNFPKECIIIVEEGIARDFVHHRGFCSCMGHIKTTTTTSNGISHFEIISNPIILTNVYNLDTLRLKFITFGLDNYKLSDDLLISITCRVSEND